MLRSRSENKIPRNISSKIQLILKIKRKHYLYYHHHQIQMQIQVTLRADNPRPGACSRITSRWFQESVITTCTFLEVLAQNMRNQRAHKHFDLFQDWRTIRGGILSTEIENLLQPILGAGRRFNCFKKNMFITSERCAPE